MIRSVLGVVLVLAVSATVAIVCAAVVLAGVVSLLGGLVR